MRISGNDDGGEFAGIDADNDLGAGCNDRESVSGRDGLRGFNSGFGSVRARVRGFCFGSVRSVRGFGGRSCLCRLGCRGNGG